jgi:hypothetical protein
MDKTSIDGQDIHCVMVGLSFTILSEKPCADPMCLHARRVQGVVGAGGLIPPATRLTLV